MNYGFGGPAMLWGSEYLNIPSENPKIKMNEILKSRRIHYDR